MVPNGQAVIQDLHRIHRLTARFIKPVFIFIEGLGRTNLDAGCIFTMPAGKLKCGKLPDRLKGRADIYPVLKQHQPEDFPFPAMTTDR